MVKFKLLFKFIYILKFIVLFSSLTVASCSNFTSNDGKKSSIQTILEKSSPNWLAPHKADIVQGNYISEEMILLLNQGQTKKEVMVILGTPLIVDPFTPNRWNYVFDIKKSNGIKENRIFFVEFVNDELTKWEGNPVERSLEEKIIPK